MTFPQPGEVSGLGRSLTVRLTRPERRVALLEVAAPGYTEYFFVVSGSETVSVTAFDATDTSWDQPRIYLLPRPYDWDADGEGAEGLLLKVWQLTGYPR